MKERIERLLGARVLGSRPVGGGCIARATRVETTLGPVFAKQGTGAVAQALRCEREGLRALRDKAPPSVGVPEVLGFEEGGQDQALLVLEWIPEGRWSAASWRRLGEGLAALHAAEPPYARYGWPGDNRIGASVQQGGFGTDWPRFFRDRRLAPQATLARANGRWRGAWDSRWERLLNRLADWLPSRPEPALVHGDLWSGNVLVDQAGRPWLIDPAVYVGHGEVDLAMSRLFGGFGEGFYAAYASVHGVASGSGERLTLYNLYHLLNHLNLFGDSYAGGVERVLERFGR